MYKIIKPILTLVFVIILASCKQKSEDPADYINFLINETFQMNYLKDQEKKIEWERGGIKKGIMNFKVMENLKLKFVSHNVNPLVHEIYIQDVHGILKKPIGIIDIESVKKEWDKNKMEVGILKFGEKTLLIDLEAGTVESRTAKNKEIFEKVKS